ncbi:MAG: cupin domain-containing protein [Lysobacter sp.]|nr:cupin domain-containing protein [Lysobacter sp.]
MRPAVLFAGLALAVATATAQSPGIQRQVLQRAAGPDGGHEVLLVRIEIAPGAAAGRHSHPGVETGYLLEGEAVMEVDGEAPRRLGPGDTYLIPAGRIHDARAVGARPVTVIATFVVERGKPLATPAP